MTTASNIHKVDLDSAPQTYRRKAYDPGIVIVPIATFVVAIVSLWSGVKALLPLLTTAVGYVAFYHLVARNQFRRCVVLMLLWATSLSMAVMLATLFRGPEVGGAIIYGETYWTEMSAWVRTGEGAESTPSRFIPQHVLHFGLFAALSLLTGGLGGLVMGSILMAYMSYYVGMLAFESSDPFAMLLGWHVWAVVRVVAYIIAATVFAHLCFATLKKKIAWSFVKNGTIAVFVMLVADVLLKLLLAPTWREMLKDLLPNL